MLRSLDNPSFCPRAMNNYRIGLEELSVYLYLTLFQDLMQLRTRVSKTLGRHKKEQKMDQQRSYRKELPLTEMNLKELANVKWDLG